MKLRQLSSDSAADLCTATFFSVQIDCGWGAWPSCGVALGDRVPEARTSSRTHLAKTVSPLDRCHSPDDIDSRVAVELPQDVGERVHRA